MVNLISFKKMALLGLMLIAGSTGSMSYAQNDKNNEVSLVVSGEGPTKDEATKVALRSAIEQTYGTFVSSNTTILNDNLVKDEIVSVSTGNIKSFNYLSQDETNGKWSVSLQAIVSIGKLIEYAKSKGSEAELAGATFAMNMKIQQLNKKNQDIALEHLISQLKAIIPTIFDYELEVGEPKYEKDPDRYFVPISISVITNKNINACFELFITTLKALSVPQSEFEIYKDRGLEFYNVSLYYYNKNNGSIRERTEWNYILRGSSYSLEKKIFKDLLRYIGTCMCSFKFSDGITTFRPLIDQNYNDIIIFYLQDSERTRVYGKYGNIIDVRDKKLDSSDSYKLDYKDSKGKYYTIQSLCNIPWGKKLFERYVYYNWLVGNYWGPTYFSFFTPNQNGKKLTEIKFELAYTIDELSKISKFNITPTYKK